MPHATVAQNLISVRPHVREDMGGAHFLTVDCPDGWDDVKKVCKKVLQFEGRNYTFTGWNSDRNQAFFRETPNVATIATRK